VRIKGSRDMWRVQNVAGRTAVLANEDGNGGVACVPFEEMSLVGEWAHVWHLFDVAREQAERTKQVNAALVALAGTAVAMHTRSSVESYLGSP